MCDRAANRARNRELHVDRRMDDALEDQVPQTGDIGIRDQVNQMVGVCLLCFVPGTARDLSRRVTLDLIGNIENDKLHHRLA